MSLYPPLIGAEGSKLKLLHHREQLACSLNDSSQLTQTLAANLREGVAVFGHDLRLVLWTLAWKSSDLSERVRSLSGELALEGAPGHGTTLRVRLRVN